MYAADTVGSRSRLVSSGRRKIVGLASPTWPHPLLALLRPESDLANFILVRLGLQEPAAGRSSAK